MGFGGNVIIDVANTPEKLYQNLVGNDATCFVRNAKLTADSDNGGNIMIGPFRDVSIVSPKYGDFEMEPGDVVWIEATEPGERACLEEWWCIGDTAGDQLRWCVAVGASTSAESKVV